MRPFSFALRSAGTVLYSSARLFQPISTVLLQSAGCSGELPPPHSTACWLPERRCRGAQPHCHIVLLYLAVPLQDGTRLGVPEEYQVGDIMHVKIDLLQTPFDDMQLSLGGKARRLSCRSTMGYASSVAAVQLPGFPDPGLPVQLLLFAASWTGLVSEFRAYYSVPTVGSK